jgi:hypothetical protein
MLQYFKRWQPISADCNPLASSKGCLVIAKIVMCQFGLCCCTGNEVCVIFHRHYHFWYIPEPITSNVYEVEFCFNSRCHAIGIICQLLPNALLERGTIRLSYFMNCSTKYPDNASAFLPPPCSKCVSTWATGILLRLQCSLC